MSNQLTPNYWNERYLHQNTPWDIGSVSPALKNYLDQVTNPMLPILIPGAGNAYEAIYAHRQGFQNVFVCDWAPAAFEHLKRQAPDFPIHHLLVEDFFRLEMEVDVILEQTFFCAIDPTLRKAYVKKAFELLAPDGKLTGLLFAQHFEHDGPPFGGSQEEYMQLFSPYFHILYMDININSIEPRKGRELFFECQKNAFIAP
ncbi:MAG: SAM-dependent methyltransferase [Saprospiraceae bacterium]|nr:SAM-dependent methyltransferase [Saprospiraceae bacterium]